MKNKFTNLFEKGFFQKFDPLILPVTKAKKEWANIHEYIVLNHMSGKEEVFPIASNGEPTAK